MKIVYEIEENPEYPPGLSEFKSKEGDAIDVVKFSVCDDDYFETTEAYLYLLEEAVSALHKVFSQLSADWQLGIVFNLRLEDTIEEVNRVERYKKVWKNYRMEEAPEYWQAGRLGEDVVMQTPRGARALGVLLTDISFLHDVLRATGINITAPRVFLTNTEECLEEGFVRALGSAFDSSKDSPWLRFFVERGDIPIRFMDYGGITPALEVSAFWRKGLIEEPDVFELARMGEEGEA